jgi:purine-binding chemotaxis protein CheW
MSRAVDWADLRRRLSLAASQADPQEGPAGDRHRQVLDERARALARPPMPSKPHEEITLVGFGLGGESWTVEARFVWEAFQLRQLVPLPGAPAPAAGVCPWRGSVLLVLDVRGVLGVPVAPLADLVHVLVLGDRQPAFGVLADTLGEVTKLDRAALAEPAEGVAIHREWVLGVTPEAAFALNALRLIEAHT